MNVNIDYFLNKRLVKIEGKKGDDELKFYFKDNTVYKMYHEQDCCENVWLEDIEGSLDDLIGPEILQAEVVTSDRQEDDNGYDVTDWTFYKLATINGYVTLRWCCTSNGFYSTDVDIKRIFDLLPCPFCGCKEVELETTDDKHYYFECGYCSAKSTYMEKDDISVEWWNARVA